MQVGVGILWHVIVEDDVNPFNVHTPAKEVCCHQDPALEVFELLVTTQSVVVKGLVEELDFLNLAGSYMIKNI